MRTSSSSSLEPLAVQRRGHGKPLLLVHGFTGAAVDWVHVFPQAPDGRELIEVDLPGHGQSSPQSEAEDFSFRASADRLECTLAALDLSEPVDAIGLSGGALTLLHLGLLAPRRLRRQVLVSATPYFPPQARRIMATVDPDAQPEAEWEAMRARHPGGDEQIRRLWRWSNGLQRTTDDVDFTRETLAAIDRPTLVVHGDRDPLYPVLQAVTLYESLGDAELWVLPRGGHAPIFGADAATFRERALAFLGRRNGAAGAEGENSNG